MPAEKGNPPPKRVRKDLGPPEVEDGPRVPILEHSKPDGSSCPSLMGQVIEFDLDGVPKRARCILPECRKIGIINSAQM